MKFIEVFKPENPLSEAGGFHIVIANPPYGGTPVTDAVRFAMFPRADGPMSKDLYGIFLGRALQLLAPGGVSCYIVSNTWRTIKSFKPLRVEHGNRDADQRAAACGSYADRGGFDGNREGRLAHAGSQPASCGKPQPRRTNSGVCAVHVSASDYRNL